MEGVFGKMQGVFSGRRAARSVRRTCSMEGSLLHVGRAVGHVGRAGKTCWALCFPEPTPIQYHLILVSSDIMILVYEEFMRTM